MVLDISWLQNGINEINQAFPIFNCYKSQILASSWNQFCLHQLRKKKRELQDPVVSQQDFSKTGAIHKAKPGTRGTGNIHMAKKKESSKVDLWKKELVSVVMFFLIQTFTSISFLEVTWVLEIAMEMLGSERVKYHMVHERLLCRVNLTDTEFVGLKNKIQKIL